MDVEKQPESLPQLPARSLISPHTQSLFGIKLVRSAQYIWSTISLVFICCAIDRNILMPGVTAEEKLLCASSILATLITLYHLLTLPASLPTTHPHKRPTTTILIDALTATLLLAAFVYGAYCAAQGQGACAGPDKIGVWDNTRGCRRMTVATGFSAVNFGAFVGSVVLVGVL